MSSLLENLHTFRALTLLLFIISTHLNVAGADAGFLGLSCHDLLNDFPAGTPAGKNYCSNSLSATQKHGVFCHVKLHDYEKCEKP